MKYINEDLKFIFIRVQDDKGNWINVSIKDANKKQFESWLMKRWGKGKRFWKSIDDEVENNEWADDDKLEMLNWLADRGAVFVMIKRGKIRKNFGK